MKKNVLVLVISALVAVLSTHPAWAIDKCKVKVDGKTGVINVTAVGASGPVLWGESAEAANKAFFNAGTCLTGSGAIGCQLADPSTVEAKTPPAGCTIYLDDGSTPCSAWIAGCTPGVRKVSAPEWVPPPSPRFVDNGDGTITDRQTGLMWEKKTGDLGAPVNSNCPGGPNCADVHDIWNMYTWSKGSPWDPDGSVYTVFLATLNAGSGLAGHTDWRLPTIQELDGIVARLTNGACIKSPCVEEPLIATKIVGGTYWSSTTYPDDYLDGAWLVDFSNGAVDHGYKDLGSSVRAVRAGS